jgi:hypothetical protein
VKRQKLKVLTTPLVVSGIRHQSLMLFTAAAWPPFPDSIDSTDAAAARAPVVSGSRTHFHENSER